MANQPTHRRGKILLPILLIVLLITAVIASTLIRSRSVPKQYTSKAMLMVTVTGDYHSTVSEILRDASVLITSPELLDEAMSMGELGRLPTFRTDGRPDREKLRKGLRVSVVEGSRFLELQFTGPRANDARGAVAAVSRAYKRYIERRKAIASQSARDVQINKVTGLAHELRELELEAQTNRRALAHLGTDPDKLATLDAELTQREIRFAGLSARHDTLTDGAAKKAAQAEVTLIQSELTVIRDLRDLAAKRNEEARPLREKDRLYARHIEEVRTAHRAALLELKELSIRGEREGPYASIIRPASVPADD